MAVKVVLPARAKGNLACAYGTKVYQNGVEIEDIGSFSMPECGPNDVLQVTITIPLEEVVYADE